MLSGTFRGFSIFLLSQTIQETIREAVKVSRSMVKFQISCDRRRSMLNKLVLLALVFLEEGDARVALLVFLWAEFGIEAIIVTTRNESLLLISFGDVIVSDVGVVENGIDCCIDI